MRFARQRVNRGVRELAPDSANVPTSSPSGHVDPKPSADDGPARFHHLHGSIPLGPGQELRITTQAARGDDRPARLVIRPWREAKGRWWPVAHDQGITVDARDMLALSRAVANAVLFLRCGAHPSAGESGAPHARGESETP
jgi:hypothetical protein